MEQHDLGKGEHTEHGQRDQDDDDGQRQPDVGRHQAPPAPGVVESERDEALSEPGRLKLSEFELYLSSDYRS